MNFKISSSSCSFYQKDRQADYDDHQEAYGNDNEGAVEHWQWRWTFAGTFRCSSQRNPPKQCVKAAWKVFDVQLPPQIVNVEAFFLRGVVPVLPQAEEKAPGEEGATVEDHRRSEATLSTTLELPLEFLPEQLLLTLHWLAQRGELLLEGGRQRRGLHPLHASGGFAQQPAEALQRVDGRFGEAGHALGGWWGEGDDGGGDDYEDVFEVEVHLVHLFWVDKVEIGGVFVRTAKVSVVFYFVEKRFDFGDFVSSFCRELGFSFEKLVFSRIFG